MNSYMENINHVGLLEIKASCNEFYLGEEIQLIALRESIYGIQEIQNVKWEIDYIGNEIVLKNSVIRISSSLKDIKYLKVTCEDRDTGDIRVYSYYVVVDIASRKFPIILKEKKETLVHFIKNDGDYFGNGYKWDLWAFSMDGTSYEVQLNEKSDFGKCAFVKEENVIARRKAWGENWGNDWSEQTVTFEIPKKARNCYIVYGENKLLTDINEVIDFIKPRIEVAIMDDENYIVAFLSREPLDITEFYIYINGVMMEKVI